VDPHRRRLGGGGRCGPPGSGRRRRWGKDEVDPVGPGGHRCRLSRRRRSRDRLDADRRGRRGRLSRSRGGPKDVRGGRRRRDRFFTSGGASEGRRLVAWLPRSGIALRRRRARRLEWLDRRRARRLRCTRRRRGRWRELVRLDLGHVGWGRRGHPPGCGSLSEGSRGDPSDEVGHRSASSRYAARRRSSSASTSASVQP
jgi:hypothetical protein